MPDVSISIESDVTAYFLSVFNNEGFVFRGDANEDFEDVLDEGDYTLLYHVIAPSQTDFEILFEGVKHPESPLARRVPNKGYTASTRSVEV